MTPMSRRKRPLRTATLALLLLAGLLATVPAAPAAAARAGHRAEVPADLAPQYKAWLAEVGLIITDAEWEAFLKLEKDYQRDAFIERFWQVRDPYPDTARNEAREAWESRKSQAEQEFASLDEDRARFFLLNGPPSATLQTRCIELWPLEIWVYAPTERLPESLVLIFFQRFAQGPYIRWDPNLGLEQLFQFPQVGSSTSTLMRRISSGCQHSDQIIAAIGSILRMGAVQYTIQVTAAEKGMEPVSREWVATFNSYSTDLPEDAAALQGELSIDFPGRRQSRSILQGTVAVPTGSAGVADQGGSRSYNFLLNGEVLLDRKLFDAFRYKFDFPASEVTAGTIPLVFERFLRPGSYKLIVRVEDLNSHALLRKEIAVEVPQLDEMPTTTIDDETERLLAEANAVLSSLETTIEIVRPRGDFQSGLVRFDTLSSGSDIKEVEFLLDGRPILRKNRPPFSVELDLGEVPQTRTLTAVAYNAAGEEIASDEELLNASPHRFSVRLVEPRPGRKFDRSLRAEAVVEVPEDAAVERVELYVNERLAATLFQPPWTQAIVIPPDEFVAYVRAVAYQTDGNSTEDLVFVNAPENLDQLEIQFVELYTAVVDRQNRPVEGLGKDDFTVSEDGVEQQVVRFEKVENLPIHVAVLLDVSASMGEEGKLDAAREAALKFFQEAILPRDRASLIPFNDRPSLAVKMTSRQEDLAAGLAGLKAERGTSLYDSIIFSLFYFNGIKGQRAVLLLSDGEDENSKFSKEQTLDFARHAGVSIYPIGLDLRRSDFETRKLFKTLAEETGGEAFFISDISELGEIYASIQRELRSRYLIAYQSSNTSRDQKFRTIEVKVDRPGVEVKTLRGYFP